MKNFHHRKNLTIKNFKLSSIRFLGSNEVFLLDDLLRNQIFKTCLEESTRLITKNSPTIKTKF